MNDMPSAARLSGPSSERVETVFSGLPLNPTRVPLRVYRFWEAEMFAERREKVEPRTSKRASTYLVSLQSYRTGAMLDSLPAIPGELLSKLCSGPVDDGVADIWT